MATQKPHGNEGKIRSPETRLKDRLVKLGKTASDETKRKMSETHRKFGTGKWMLGKKHHSQEHKNKLKERWKGENNPNWRGGITPITRMIRTSLEYKIWRKSVFERDNFTCIWCAQKGGEIHADHIKPFALYPELRFAIDNGRTLCKECHLTTETYGNKKEIYG